MEQDFNQWIGEYSRDIFRFVRAHTRDAGEAEDLTQEVFLRAYRSLGPRPDVNDAKAWLFKTAMNVCRDAGRRRLRRPLVYMRDAPDSRTSPAADEEVIERETARQLLDAVLRLPDRYKDVILLFYVESRSITEISHIMGIPESTVKTRLHRARRQLRAMGGVIGDEATQLD